jgi:hypothetical protein
MEPISTTALKMHYHLTVDHIVIYGLSALIFFNLLRIVAVMMAKQDGPLGTIGRSLGATVTFSGS